MRITVFGLWVMSFLKPNTNGQVLPFCPTKKAHLYKIKQDRTYLALAATPAQQGPLQLLVWTLALISTLAHLRVTQGPIRGTTSDLVQSNPACIYYFPLHWATKAYHELFYFYLYKMLAGVLKLLITEIPRLLNIFLLNLALWIRHYSSQRTSWPNWLQFSQKKKKLHRLPSSSGKGWSILKDYNLHNYICLLRAV